MEKLLADTKDLSHVEKKYPDQAMDKIENIQELGAAIADFAAAYPDANIAEWLQTITLVSSESENKGGVSLMTLHMAKGLEFPRVYIVGLEEGLLPHRSSIDNEDSVEEERRLFYVGMTRAKQKLSLCGAYRRRTYNQWAANRPSRFLTEIPREYFAEMEEVEAGAVMQDVGSIGYADGPRYEYDDVGSAPIVQVSIGQVVRHPTYGRGTVEQMSDEFGVLKAVVRFDEFGMRKVVLKHLQ
jgi:DNA helicase-2/ATP-dependent DNA helicase PcrA